MKISAYLDHQAEPFCIFSPPQKLELDTCELSNGEHVLLLRAENERGEIVESVTKFTVHNGPEVILHGLKNGETVKGKLQLLANAYSSNLHDEFQLHSIETPRAIPTWAWVMVLCVFTWGLGYIFSEFANPRGFAAVQPVVAQSSTNSGDGGVDDWVKLGDQVYGNNCASCHQKDGSGMAGVFPPLSGNAVVLAQDPSEHILTVLNGLSGKAIDGVEYASPMPPFANLTDEEVAAVVNHERSQWGNDAPLVSEGDVAALRAD